VIPEMTYNNNNDFESSNNSSTIYTDKDYEKITGGKYGKEIFVPHDESNNANNSIIFSAVLDEEELISKIHTNDVVEYFFKMVKKTVKCEDVLVRQIGYTGLSSYIEDDPINLGIMAPTSEGKTYPVEETLKFFPKDDVYKIGSMSAKVLVRKKGVLVNKNLEPIEEKLKTLYKNKAKTKDQDEKDQISDEIDKLYDDAKTLIDLRGKILVFLEPPDKEVWTILKPILSHDSPEIEYPFVNQTDREGHQTKDVVVRGWPSCIFCSARDESKWDMWPEIKSRFLISSPNMIPQKYQESKELISIRKGFPNLIQQQIVLSDNEIELARDCILLIKQKITELRSKNNKDGKISIWIPYAKLLEKELPATKGTDVRLVKRIFSLLNVVPIVKFNLRKMLILCSTGDEYKEEEEETSVIADLDDLKEVLSINQNFEGIPKYKIEFFNDVFYPCFKSKNEVPDSSKDGSKQEDRIAVTARQLCDAFKKVKGKSITTDNLKKTYLDELMSNGLIDYDKSNIDAKQYIYYPIVEPFASPTATSDAIVVAENEEKSLSLLSNSDQFDNVSQYSSSIYEKITKNIIETWLFYEIMRLLCYRIDTDSIQGPLADYLNNSEEFRILDNASTNTTTNTLNYSQVPQEEDRCCCYDNNHNYYPNSNRLTIRQFTKYYTSAYSFYRFDNKRSPNIAPFGKISLIKSNLAKFDNKDIITKNIAEEKISNTIIQTQESPSSLISCHYCNYTHNDEKEVERHSVISHPGKPARPDPEMLKLLQEQQQNEKKEDTKEEEEEDDDDDAEVLIE
jgi:hypothetical protein